jgi:putative salt-induced outer membrane protein YdiY
MLPPLVLIAFATALRAALAAELPTPPAPTWAQDPAPSAADAAAADTDPKWTGSITVGGVVTTGNSETRAGNATADAVRERKERDRITLGFLWVYADEKNSTGDWNLTDRKTSARAKYDYFLTEKTYLFATASAEADELADLDLRTTVGAGVGRQFVDGERFKLAGEAGLSYVSEDFATSSDNEFLAARLAANTSYEHSEIWSLAHTLELFPSLESQDDFYGRSDLRLKATLTENMLAQGQWVLDYNNQPAAGRHHTDNRFLLSIGWKF